MPIPNTPASPADLARLIARVEKLERLFTAIGPNTLAGLLDVDIYHPTQGDVPTYIDADRKWENRPGGAGAAASALYFDASTVQTSVPGDTSLTPLTWPTLALGTALLNLADPTAPLVLADGVYTINPIIEVDANEPTPTVVVNHTMQAKDPPSSPIFVAGGGFGTSREHGVGGSMTSALHAGSDIKVIANQGSASPVDVALVAVVVTWQAATIL